MKILNGQLKLWVWRSREKDGIETAWHTARVGNGAGEPREDVRSGSHLVRVTINTYNQG